MTEAQRLADVLCKIAKYPNVRLPEDNATLKSAAAELRRLEAEFEQERIDYKAKCAELEVAWAERDKLAASNKALVEALVQIRQLDANATHQRWRAIANAALAQHGEIK